jgi:hypothetical protein
MFHPAQKFGPLLCLVALRHRLPPALWICGSEGDSGDLADFQSLCRRPEFLVKPIGSLGIGTGLCRSGHMLRVPGLAQTPSQIEVRTHLLLRMHRYVAGLKE